MRPAILDSNIYIGHWEHGHYEDLLAVVRRTFLIRHSAVVLSELRRGARAPQAVDRVNSLYQLARTQWEPTAADWWAAGSLVRAIGDACAATQLMIE